MNIRIKTGLAGVAVLAPGNSDGPGGAASEATVDVDGGEVTLD